MEMFHHLLLIYLNGANLSVLIISISLSVCVFGFCSGQHPEAPRRVRDD